MTEKECLPKDVIEAVLHLVEYIKVCPNCGSTNITIPKAGLDIKMTLKDMCRDCNARGNFPEVELEQLEAFRKRLKK